MDYESFEKKLASLSWWSGEVREIDLSVAGEKVSEELRFYLSYSVHVVAGVEQYVEWVKNKLLAKVSQSVAFEFAKMVAEHEATKALIFEAVSEGDKVKVAAVKRSSEKLCGVVATLLVDRELSQLASPKSASFYQERFLQLSSLLATEDNALCSKITNESLGVR